MKDKVYIVLGVLSLLLFPLAIALIWSGSVLLFKVIATDLILVLLLGIIVKVLDE